MGYLTVHLMYFLGVHTYQKAHVYTEKIQVTNIWIIHSIPHESIILVCTDLCTFTLIFLTAVSMIKDAV